jgi:hypothetical protein
MPGGQLQISIADDFRARMTGPVVQIAEGRLSAELLSGTSIYASGAKLTDTAEKGFLTIEIADPAHALKSLKLLSRRGYSDRPSFSAIWIPYETKWCVSAGLTSPTENNLHHKTL